MAGKTPMLKTLILDRVLLTAGSGNSPPRAWPHLERLSLGSELFCVDIDWDCFGPQLRVLDLACFNHGLEVTNTHALNEPARSALARLKRLEFVRIDCKNLALEATKWLIKPSCISRTLRGLVLSTSRDMRTAQEGICFDMLDFINNEDITTMGLLDFGFENIQSYLHSKTGKPFVECVTRFPNVHTVLAYPERYEGHELVIEALVRLAANHGVIKTIYQNCLRGVQRDRILALAKEYGVEVIDRPREWPFPPHLFEAPYHKDCLGVPGNWR